MPVVCSVASVSICYRLTNARMCLGLEPLCAFRAGGVEEPGAPVFSPTL